VLGVPVVYYQVIYPIWHNHYAIEDTGLTYKNYPLGFQISRPNLNWSFDRNLTDFAQKIGVRTSNPDIVGGIIVESPNKEYVNVIVLKVNPSDTTYLNRLANEQSQMVKTNFPNALVQITPSTNGDSIVLDAVDVPSTPILHIHEKIESRGDKLYLVGIVWDSEQPISAETYKEFYSLNL
jgi:hypothetical protein